MLIRPARRPPVEISERLRSAGVAALNLGDPKSGVTDQVVDLTIQVAAAGESPPRRIETALPTLYAWIRRPPMLDEDQPAPRLQHAPDLTERTARVGNGTQRPRRYRRVGRRIVKRDALSRCGEEFDLTACDHPPPGHELSDLERHIQC